VSFRTFNRLAAGGRELLAWGSMEGVWRSTSNGSAWTKLEIPGGEQLIYTVAASPTLERPCLLVSTSEELLLSEDGGQSWQTVVPDGTIAVAFSPAFARDGQAWAVTVSGELLAASNGGLTWSSRPRPMPHGQLVGLDVGSRRVAVAMHEAGTERSTLWRSEDSGHTWDLWLEQETRQPTAVLSLGKDAHGQDLVALGRACWRLESSGWEKVLETKEPVLRILQRPDKPGVLLLTPSEVLHSVDGRGWTSYDEGLTGQVLVDLAFFAPASYVPRAYLLTNDCGLWQRKLSSS
jgi:photosystem II stability/assembly factor-like uncharacterized protein